MENEQFILMAGNPAEGYRFIGPFTSFDAAWEYQRDHTGGSFDWIATLEKPV
jgi:hypothetical protein